MNKFRCIKRGRQISTTLNIIIFRYEYIFLFQLKRESSPEYFTPLEHILHNQIKRFAILYGSMKAYAISTHAQTLLQTFMSCHGMCEYTYICMEVYTYIYTLSTYVYLHLHTYICLNRKEAYRL